MREKKQAKVFFGLPVKDQDLEIFKRAMCEVNPKLAQTMRWVHPGDCHLTMRYLGFVTKQNLPYFIDSARCHLESTKKFTILINKIANFPRKDSKLLAASAQLNDSLAKLHINIEAAVTENGLLKENRRFKPHITLARSKSHKSIWFEPILDINYKIVCNELILYESKPSEHGGSYRALHTFTFE